MKEKEQEKSYVNNFSTIFHIFYHLCLFKLPTFAIT
ncbi:hypothetical protein M2137_000657 [Parabacteroides sp. PFB2-10]|nr:hypothetical protein [Parabacteroides sp. PFB2-10]